MATHILTVDETTFKTHLEFMFIGTGKNDSAHQSGALADILSIRENDEIIFYVMKKGFFGIFKAVGDVFYDYSSYEEFHPQYLDHLLGGKTLTYRMEIQPKEVYQKFISEWDMMENPAKIPNHSIFNMQWSWIFKKLKGNRGCISIDSYEYELFKNSLVENNNLLPRDVKKYTYRESEIHVLDDNLIYEEECKKTPPRDEERLNTIQTEVDLRILFTSRSNRNDLLNIIF